VNFSLLLPSALLALTALILPLLIHLSRRSEQKPTDFAALRWISTQLRPRRKWVLQEILLLLLRLLLLIALAFFLAKPVSIQPASPKHWVLVLPGANIDMAKNLPSRQTSEWHWLTAGFPDFEDKPNAANIPLSSLLRELDAQLPANAAITIIVPETLSGLDGERIRLGRKVDWKMVPGNMPLTAIAQQSQAIRLAIRHDSQHGNDAIYFHAAHAAWQAEQKTNEKQALDSADISSPLTPGRSALIWLSTAELPMEVRAWIKNGGTLFVSKEVVVPEIKSGVAAWRNDQGKVLALVAPFGQGRILQWQQDLKPEAMPELLDADFPEKLKSLLQTKPLAPSRAFAKSQSPLMGAKAVPQMPQSLQTWLALLIVLLFVLERWLANAARRWSAA
jgi:hypothetical protein